MSVTALKKNESQDRLIQMLETALGPQISTYLNDPLVVEIMLNPDGSLWIDKLGEGRSFTGHKVNSSDAQRIIFLIASSTGAVCSSENPIISAEFPGSGNRFQGLLPPVVSLPTFTIRKKAIKLIPFEDYIKDGIMTEAQMNVIKKAIWDKKNILVVGGTGSGKTTFVNAVLNVISQTDSRLVIIEDTLELQCTAPDTVFLRSNEKITMNDLLKATMRLRPDRIVVGEVRGPEALTLLKAWNTGHPGGCATVHANSARGGLSRLEQLILEAVSNPLQKLIAEAVNVIVFIERFNNSRRISEVMSVEGYEQGEYILKAI